MWVWLLAITPLVQVLALQPILVGVLQAVGSSSSESVPEQTVDLVVVGFVADLIISVALIGVSGLLSWLDWRRLRDQVARPFPWGWGFIEGVYLVGRAVVLRRRGRRGAAPLVLAACLFAAGQVAVVIEFGVIVSTAAHHSLDLG